MFLNDNCQSNRAEAETAAAAEAAHLSTFTHAGSSKVAAINRATHSREGWLCDAFNMLPRDF